MRYSSRSPLLRPCWQASRASARRGASSGCTRSSQPRSPSSPPSRPSSCRQEGSRLRPCPADQVQIPASNIAMACAISVTSRGVVTSTPGVSYLSITRLETGSEYLSKQSHSISNIGTGAEQPRQHRWPRTSRPRWRHQRPASLQLRSGTRRHATLP